MERMTADIADRPAWPRSGRVGPAKPRLSLPGWFQWSGEPRLRVFDLHHPERADVAPRHHGARVAHHRVAGIIVGDGEYAPFSAASRTSSSASAGLVASGLSQITCKPASSAARATGWCMWFGVTIVSLLQGSLLVEVIRIVPFTWNTAPQALK